MNDVIAQQSDEEKKSQAETAGGNGTELEKQSEEYKQKWQRAVADYRNLQKEVDEKLANWIVVSKREIVAELWPVYENFKKAFANERGTLNQEQLNWVKGIEFIKKQFVEVLKRHGVEEIETVGEQFDPERHESVGEEDIAGTKEHEIVREVAGGYMMNGKVIKPAKVILAKVSI